MVDITIFILFAIICALLIVWREYEGQQKGIKIGYDTGYRAGSVQTYSSVIKQLQLWEFITPTQVKDFEKKLTDEFDLITKRNFR